MSRIKLNAQAIAADLATISLSGHREAAFHEALLKRVAKFMGAPGGALWLIAGDGSRDPNDWSLASALGKEGDPLLTRRHFQPAVQACVNHTLLQSTRLLVKPGGTIDDRLHLRNESGASWYFHRLQFKSRLLGVIGFALPATITTPHIERREPILDTLGQYIVTHAANSHRQRHAEAAGSPAAPSGARQARRLSKLLQFSNGLVGQLDKPETALYVANQTRDLLGIDRASVLERKTKGTWAVLAVSGNETVDKHSNFVRALGRLCPAEPNADRPADGHRLHRLPDGPVEGQRRNGDSDDPREAFAMTCQTREILFIPLPGKNRREDFCLALESAKTGAFAADRDTAEETDAGTMSQEMQLKWVSNIASRALAASREHHELPLRGALSRVRDWFHEDNHGHLRRRALWVGGILLVLGGVFLWPMQLKSSGQCWLYPVDRDVVVAEATGRIEKVLVEEGARVAEGQLLGAFDTLQWKTERDIATQERRRAETEMRRHQSAGDMTAYQVARLEAEKSGQMQAKYENLVRRGMFRSPLDGVVLTKDIHKSIGKVLQTGEVFCEVASLDNWELQIAIDESDFTTLERSLDEQGSLDVAYILNADSSLTLETTLGDSARVSQMAYASGDRNIFFVTIPHITLPDSLADRVRPGFSGTARIRMGRQPLGFVIFRKFIHLLRMNWII